MDRFDKEKNEREKTTKVKTFTVPFDMGNRKENIILYTKTDSKPSQEQIINQAFKFHAQGNTSEAAKYYQYFIEQGFKDYRVLSNYGTILKDIGKLKEAELLTRKAINLNPNFADAHSNLGAILKDTGKLKEAEGALRKAIEIKPDYLIAHCNLGNILRDLGKLKEAEVLTRKAIELNPNFANAHFNLGNILKDLGKLKEAELSTRRAISINPNYAEAHANLGSTFSTQGKLEEAELSLRKAIELMPQNKNIQQNLIQLLTIHKPKKINSNSYYIINEEFKEINLLRPRNSFITDKEAITVYNDGLRIYQKYNLNMGTELSQIYIRNEVNLNCKRHKLIFEQHKIIPEFCFGCYKVQIEASSIIELLKLSLVFNNLNLKNNNTRKSMIELRKDIPGFYKGLIYCLGLKEALLISQIVNLHIKNNIRVDLISKVKRGCSEYAQEFPQYKEIKTSSIQPMQYNENWKSIEEEIDKGNKNWGISNKSIKGFNLNDFLIMRNWISYAQKIGDHSVNKVTNEQIKGPESFKNLDREFNLKPN